MREVSYPDTVHCRVVGIKHCQKPIVIAPNGCFHDIS